MQKNVGGMDRIVRLIVGPLLILAGIAGYVGSLGLAVGPVPQALASVIVFLVGAILLVTGAVRTCPLNRLLGFDTYHGGEPGEPDPQAVSDQK